MTLLEDLFCYKLKHRLEATEAGLRLTQKELETQKKLTEMNKKNYEMLSKQALMYRTRIEHMQQALDESIQIPVLSIHTEPEWLFDPYDLIWPVNDVLVADEEYYALPYDTWMKILPPIQVETVKARGKWVKEISDCDNFATTMYDFMSILFLKAGLKRQGGFMVVWSRTHAFNAFIDVDGKSYIYEPQNGSIVGRLDEGSGSYIPRKIWFPGTTPYTLQGRKKNEE